MSVADQVAELSRHLGADYELGDQIGEGASSYVFQATDLKHGREVAVKLLRPELASSLAGERFHREIRLAARLQHPNILPVYDSGGDGRCLYYVMPVTSGRSLRDRLRDEGPLPVGEALEIIGDVGAALEFAHRQGIVHRDIKPANVLLTAGGAVVADFGLARAVSEAGEKPITESGLSLGTPPYMSPEQGAGGRDVGPQSDQYSLACVLYEMLAGEPLFTGRSAWAVIARHLHEPPPSLEVVRPGIPGSIVAAIDRALSKVPSDRFPSVAEFLTGLTDPGLGRGRSEHRTHRWVLGGGLALVLASVLMYALLSAPDLNPHRIVGFPLESFGTPPAGQSGADLAIVMGAGLDHAAPLKWYDGWKWLPEDARVGGVDPSSAVRIAQSLGARYYLVGTVQHGLDSTRVVVALMDAAGDSLVQRETEVGRNADTGANRLALRALVRLLPILLDTEGRSVDLSHLLDRNASAVAAWMTGDRLYRSSRFDAALESYQTALNLDSLLVLAALKGAQAASWLDRPGDARALVDRALAHAELLPTHQQLYASGLRSYLAGDADDALGSVSRALELDDEWPEAWMTHGEISYHLIPVDWDPGTAAQEAFETVMRLDPGFTPAAIHLGEIRVRSGDEEGAADLLRHLSSLDAAPAAVDRLEWMLACLRDGSGSVPWDVRTAQSIQTTLNVGRALAAAGAHPRCAEEGFRRILGASSIEIDASATWSALTALFGVLLAQGRADEVPPILDRAFDEGLVQVGLLYLSADAFGRGLTTQATEFEEFVTDLYRTTYGPDYLSRATVTTLWTLGTWYASRGDRTSVESLAEAVARRAEESGDPIEESAARALGGWRHLVTGDTAAAIRMFRELRPSIPHTDLAWDLWGGFASEKIMLAQLLLLRGEFQEAFDVAALFDHPQPVTYLPHLPVSLAVRAAASDQLGFVAEARRVRERLSALGWEGRVSRLLRSTDRQPTR